MPDIVCANPPLSVTVYDTVQSDVDAVHDTSAVVWVTRVAMTPVGVVGRVHVVAKDPVPAVLEPPSLLATTSILYVVSGLSPV